MTLRQPSDLLPVTDGTDPATWDCAHRWRLEDRTPHGLGLEERVRRGDWYMCEVCIDCRAIRCDSYNGSDLTNRCVHPRHHRCDHEYEKGGVIPVGGGYG